MNIPPFNDYFPSETNMDEDQLSFYKSLEQSLQKGEFVDVQGNISYVFVFLYKVIAHWNKRGFETIYEYLIYVSEMYAAEKKLSDYCNLWAYDCLLGLQKYELYLEKTEPKNPFGTLTHQSNLRLNIQKNLGLDANPIDIILMAGGRNSKIVSNNEGIYRDKINEVFAAYAVPLGGWFSILDKWLPSRSLANTYLFGGVQLPIPRPQASIKTYSYYSNNHLDVIQALSRDAENLVRVSLGIPKVGEGWVSETQLFRLLEKTFPQTSVVQHGHPDWLELQHFDIWFPLWNIAVEYHGSQHFGPVEIFGGKKGFEETKRRDRRKLALAQKHGVKLFIVTEEDDIDKIIDEIKAFMTERKNEPPRIT